MSSFNSKLLNILICPISKEPLQYDEENQELISKKACIAYPIREGIPIMLVHEGRVIKDN